MHTFQMHIACLYGYCELCTLAQSPMIMHSKVVQLIKTKMWFQVNKGNKMWNKKIRLSSKSWIPFKFVLFLLLLLHFWFDLNSMDVFIAKEVQLNSYAVSALLLLYQYRSLRFCFLHKGPPDLCCFTHIL